MSRATRRASQSITIETVATRAGVSAMTVSNVLNNRRSVRPATREAVLKAVEELGYKPNAAARSLASAATTRIGLISGNQESGFLSSIFSGAITQCSDMGVQLLLRRFADADLQALVDAIEQMAQSGVGAVIAHPPYCDLLSRADVKLPIPIVAISPGNDLENMAGVRIDDRAAAAEMTRYLISIGHRRIGFIRLGQNILADETRYLGYCDALAEAGLDVDAALVAQGKFAFGSGLAPSEALLSLPNPPTAIFASNDELAAAVVSVAHRRGLEIPRQLSVAGFDDGPLAVKIWPPLTTVHQPVAAIAAAAAKRAAEIAREPGEPVDIETLRLEYRLVIRDSTAPPEV